MIDCCKRCGRVLSADEKAVTRKLINRGMKEYFCVDCLAAHFEVKKEDILDEVNKGVQKPHGTLWYSAGCYLYVPCAVILCCVALVMKVAF